jgi:hypothetical protein
MPSPTLAHCTIDFVLNHHNINLGDLVKIPTNP